jgi:hypothetical protein
VYIIDDHFLFGFYQKKVTKPKLFKKNRNQTETGSNRLVLFGFLGQNQFKPIWLGFFFVWFFRYQAYKTKTEPDDFFKILIGFFSWFGIFYFFFRFSRFNQFFSFFSHPYTIFSEVLL